MNSPAECDDILTYETISTQTMENTVHTKATQSDGDLTESPAENIKGIVTKILNLINKLFQL